MRVQLLGPVRAWGDDKELEVGPPGRRAVFGLLALAVGQPVPRREIVRALWGGQPPATAENVIQTHIKHLRHFLEPGRSRRAPSQVLPAFGDGYALCIPADRVDLTLFRDLTAAALRSFDARREAALLKQALRLWQGAPLADVSVLSSHPGVVSLNGQRRAALARYAEASMLIGDTAYVLPLLEQHADAQPLDEVVQALLLRVYRATGQRARALTVYDTVRRRLADELGVDPGPELTAAYLSLLRDRGSVAAPRSNSPAPVVRPRAVPRQLPADVPFLVGRDGALADISGILCNSAPIVAVTGTAGVGKTAVAVRWAHLARDEYPDGQLFMDLRGYAPGLPVSPGEALMRLLSCLGVDGRDIPIDLDDRAARYRSEIADRRMVIILDNAVSADEVRPLLPGTRSCAVLVTSRDRLAGLVALHGAHRVDLDLLPLADAQALLRGLIGARVDAEPDAAAALALQCARLPLALRVAAEHAAAHPGVKLADLVEYLAGRGRLRLLDADGDTRTAIRPVFSWSHRYLPTDAARTFRLLGVHPAGDFDAYAVARLIGAEVEQAERHLSLLARVHLVEPAGGRRFGMHGLLRAYAADLARAQESPADLRAALTRVSDYYLAAAAAS